MVHPTKKSENAPVHKANVVGKHRLAEGSHSQVFPQHVGDGTGSWHGGPRNGHGGSHTVTSKGRK
jgi:hypothetical protein